MRPAFCHGGDIRRARMNGMNDLQVSAEKTLRAHRRDVTSAAACLTHAPVAVHRNRQICLTCSVPFPVVDLGLRPERTAQGHPQRNAMVGFRGGPLRAEAIEIAEIHEPVAGKIVRAAIREAASNAHVNLGQDIGIRVCRRPQIVVPVVYRGDARVQRLRQGQTGGAIEVERTVKRAPARVLPKK